MSANVLAEPAQGDRQSWRGDRWIARGGDRHDLLHRDRYSWREVDAELLPDLIGAGVTGVTVHRHGLAITENLGTSGHRQRNP
jgi:hypothetical protein